MKLSHLLYVVLLILLVFTGCRGNTGTNQSTEPAAPTANLNVATEQDKASAGAAWFGEGAMTVPLGSGFTTDIYVNTGGQKLAAYTFTMTYDANLIALDTSFGAGNSGIDKGKDGFTTAINTTVPGKITISSFDVYGTGPSNNLHLLTIKWTTKSAGNSLITNSIINLNDNSTTVIGNPQGFATKIDVTTK